LSDAAAIVPKGALGDVTLHNNQHQPTLILNEALTTTDQTTKPTST
jgi:hypothetical protein